MTIETDAIVELVLQMKVPFKYRMSKSETLKWRLQQAVELTKSHILREILEDVKSEFSKNNTV